MPDVCPIDVCLNISQSEDLDFFTNANLGGFQFNHNGCIEDAYGGITEVGGFSVEFNSSQVVAFSLDGSYIPAGSDGTLLYFNGDITTECIVNATPFSFNCSAWGFDNCDCGYQYMYPGESCYQYSESVEEVVYSNAVSFSIDTKDQAAID